MLACWALSKTAGPWSPRTQVLAARGSHMVADRVVGGPECATLLAISVKGLHQMHCLLKVA